MSDVVMFIQVIEMIRFLEAQFIEMMRFLEAQFIEMGGLTLSREGDGSGNKFLKT